MVLALSFVDDLRTISVAIGIRSYWTWVCLCGGCCCIFGLRGRRRYVDGLQQVAAEYWQDTDYLGRQSPAAGWANWHRCDTAVNSCKVICNCGWPWCLHRCRSSQPCVLPQIRSICRFLSTEATGSSFCQLSSWLPQQFTLQNFLRCHWQTTADPECHCSSCDRALVMPTTSRQLCSVYTLVAGSPGN